jgi:tetratricopeptide (TPR) repeat protein
VNQQALSKTQNIQQQQLSLGGGGLLGGQLGIGGGAFGIYGGGFGLAGALAGMGGGLIGGGAGGQGGFLGGIGFQGQAVNQGFGGGFAGIGGGQLGQFGNLGGQFGLQGGDQSSLLIQLILEVVAPGEWLPIAGFNQPGGQAPPPGAAPDDPALLERPVLNSLSYYPPARALVVRGTARLHSKPLSSLIGRPANMAPAAALDRERDGALVIRPNQPKSDRVANADNQRNKPKPSVARKDPKDLDARTIWQSALDKGVKDPGVIIATADFLVQCGKFDHAAEFLKASLRRGIVGRPWVFEALAIALQASGGSAEEIERAQVSAIDLQPQDAPSYLRASQAIASHKHYDQALAFCRQAASLEPNSADPYADALAYAELSRDSEAMAWAAGSLLRRDWPVDNQELHAQARAKLANLAKTLSASQRRAEADRMQAAANQGRERDLVITMSYQGEAYVDLKVKEPIGTICSDLQRQTPGGGTLIGGNVAELSRQSYVAAQAFAGEYEVTLERIWGRPLGSKVTLEIAMNQGTAQESRERHTIVVDRGHKMKLVLGQGRRTSVASVPLTPPTRRKDKELERVDGNRILSKLRALADGSGIVETGMAGGLNSTGVAANTKPSAPPRGSIEELAYQTKVAPFVSNSMDLTAQAVVAADGSYVKLSMAPVFQTTSRTQPVVNHPLIPGGN